MRDVEEKMPEAIYSVMSSGKVQPALFPFSKLSQHVPTTSPKFWVEGFQLGLSLNPKLTLQDYLVVSDLSLIRTFTELLTKYDARVLNRHQIWLLVQYHSFCAAYEFLTIDYGSERKVAVHLPAYCAHRVEMSFKVLVLALSFYSLFMVEDIRTIDIGFDTLVTEAMKKIDSSIWMGKASKSSFLYWTLASTAAIRSKWTTEYLEAFRLRWNNLPDYTGYDYVLNSVELAIAVATPPAYYRNGTKATLYGGLLFLMAMQLVRAIEAEGLKWTPNGTSVNSILTDSLMPSSKKRPAANTERKTPTSFQRYPP
ncbi:hypothetical protein V5799_023709 [Amblyomma americanum]|uniref:Uncharacterized protein n=1 Tax=Amblyomma americanum TaxID=6943 RepID=A0AAQ4FIG6_AMBAM